MSPRGERKSIGGWRQEGEKMRMQSTPFLFFRGVTGRRKGDPLFLLPLFSSPSFNWRMRASLDFFLSSTGREGEVGFPGLSFRLAAAGREKKKRKGFLSPGIGAVPSPLIAASEKKRKKRKGGEPKNLFSPPGRRGGEKKENFPPTPSLFKKIN